MTGKMLNPLPAIAFLSAVVLGGTTMFALPKESRSLAERRPLAEAPAATPENIMNGRFFTDLDNWMADHFRNRETFRHLRVLFQTGIINETEYNGFVKYNGSLISLQKKVNEASIDYASERFALVWKKYLQSSEGRIFQTIVPDKSYFLRSEGYPVLDPDLMDRLYAESLPFAAAISIRDTLTLDDYYLTDSHWKQENLIGTAKHILKAMGRDTSALDGGLTAKYLADFLGVYAGQSAYAPDPEPISALTGGYLEGCRVIDMETRAPIAFYDIENCDERDLYTLFLGGGKGLIRIDNPNAPEGSLVLFRDSYGSAMAPLLASAYKTVYVVDLRYAHPEVLGRYIRFDGQDVLFMFSETLLNNSQGLR